MTIAECLAYLLSAWAVGYALGFQVQNVRDALGAI